MSKLLGKYTNGNYRVAIYDDGTKVRYNNDNYMEAEFPESADLKVTNFCDAGCSQCFVAGTKILMADGSTKNIEDVQIGDSIIGFDEQAPSVNGQKRELKFSKVLQTFKHVESWLMNVTTESGRSITSTVEHPFFTGRDRTNLYKGFSRIRDIHVGKTVCVYDISDTNIEYNADDYKIGYIVGSWVGDGCLSKTKDKDGCDAYGTMFFTLDNEINDRVYNYLCEYTDLFHRSKWRHEIYKDRLPMAVRSSSKKGYEFMRDLIANHISHNTTKEYACGFLAGFCDSEGHVCTNQNGLRMTNTRVDNINECERCLNILNIPYTEAVIQEENQEKNRQRAYAIDVTGYGSVLEFLRLAKPICKRKSFESYVPKCKNYKSEKIEHKEIVTKKQYVYNLETECHTYIANGFMVHNCHEQSGPHGIHGDLNNPLLDTLHPYTELAIGGGNPLEHPGLIEFLQKMKDKQIICNLTVNLEHFLKHYNELLSWSERKLIHGIGISVGRPVDEKERDLIAEFPNSVVHVIAGIVHNEVLDSLADADIRLLILGYKKVGRGIKFYEDNAVRIDQLIKILSDRLSYWRHRFKLISFDNLALNQLDVKSLVYPEEWEQSYMGDDGQYTMYIDLCKNEYAVASTMERHPIPEDIKSIDELFALVKEEAKQIKGN